MRIVVTGGAGFIGSHYVRSLLAGEYPGSDGAHVTVLDNLTYAGNLANLAPVASSPRFTFVRADIADAGPVHDVLAGADAVVHFAAESHVDRSIGGPAAFVRTNVLGTQTLLDAARAARIGRFVHVSTDEVYGSIASGSWPESHPVDPSSPYSASKAASDLLVRAYARTYGLHACITRSSNTYGPYQYPEKVIPLFVTTLLRGGSVPLYGDGGHVRDWLHVDDHCRGIHRVLQDGRAGEVYNIGGGTELTNRELTERLLAACGADWSRVRMVADRPGHDRRYSVDASKIREQLGYVPRLAFDAGLAATVRWYADNPTWWESLPRSRRPGGSRGGLNGS